MSNSYVFYQGKIVKEEEVKISIRCKAFNYGLGCFEGIRAYWDEETNQLYAFRLREHYERLLQSCKALNINIPYTVEELCDWTLKLLRKNEFKTTVYIRPVAFKGSDHLFPTLYDDDNRILIYCHPMGNFAGKDAFRVCISSWRRISDNMIPARTKPTGGYLNSALASLEALQNGYDEAILLTDSGYVCEGPGENIFIYKNGKLITPPPSDNILEGITRDTVMTLAREELGMEVVQRSITRTELYSAEEAFFSGTAMEVTPIVEIDNRKVGDGKPGEVCKKIKEIFFNITTGKNPKYAHFCTPVY
ncbi:branched-chain amino acid aminotransferase [Caminicella sporogenes DSM 14501]|uniref:Branched-chain-amino-acid aminotransferase n=1 Tax=Caminicella sporogenes DSM 14501 TaxID=1121266 RepID=A0A1M6QI28_9FIRM|nr:branched-chain amino acid transaminase [Caminicella sporogenes]RKD25307.1 branched-chain-amino-acid transaminase [Caminicella sporogenes]SHK19770.1 branched-chain amino acid aminotransferase [Caminicella sporogenes DSM 14501]